MIKASIYAWALRVAVGLLAVSFVRAQTGRLSGTWTVESTSASGAVSGAAPWGSRITTSHDAARLTVVGATGARSYALDGTAIETPLTWTRCWHTSRRTRAEEKNGQVVISEWIVTQITDTPHAHGRPCQMSDDEEDPGPPVVDPSRRGTTVALERATVVSRTGDRLVVEVTRHGPSGIVTTTTVYR